MNYNAPWRIVRNSEYTGNPEDIAISSIQDSKGQTVLFTDSGYFKPKEDYAKLIAAAPDLFEALQSIAEGTVMDQSKPYNHADTVLAYQKLASAAIAKAKGL